MSEQDAVATTEGDVFMSENETTKKVNCCEHGVHFADVCFGCNNYLETALARAEAENTRLREALNKMEDTLNSVNRMSSAGNRTLDDFMRDMSYINSLVRIALAQTSPQSETKEGFCCGPGVGMQAHPLNRQ